MASRRGWVAAMSSPRVAIWWIKARANSGVQTGLTKVSFSATPSATRVLPINACPSIASCWRIMVLRRSRAAEVMVGDVHRIKTVLVAAVPMTSNR